MVTKNCMQFSSLYIWTGICGLNFSSVLRIAEPIQAVSWPERTFEMAQEDRHVKFYWKSSWIRIDSISFFWYFTTLLKLCFFDYNLECQTYKTLTSSKRKATWSSTSVECDSSLSGWYRFTEEAGSKMPTACVPINRCNTHAPGWLNGNHPTMADGQVTKQVCFHWNSNCCYWSTNIQVRNCGEYFVYLLSGTPECSLRYCGTD